jgi:hypothetical protein
MREPPSACRLAKRNILQKGNTPASCPTTDVNLLSEIIIGPNLKMLRIARNEQHDCSGDIEQLLYEATTLLNAASLINRIARQS